MTVDGVECRVNLKNRTLVCGSNLVSNDERALFKVEVAVPFVPPTYDALEEYARERAPNHPKFAALAARAASAGSTSAQADEQDATGRRRWTLRPMLY